VISGCKAKSGKKTKKKRKQEKKGVDQQAHALFNQKKVPPKSWKGLHTETRNRRGNAYSRGRGTLLRASKQAWRNVNRRRPALQKRLKKSLRAEHAGLGCPQREIMTRLKVEKKSKKENKYVRFSSAEISATKGVLGKKGT